MTSTSASTTGTGERRIVPRRKRIPGPAERVASFAVLAVLCAAAVYLLASQARFNPAVEVALRQPVATGTVATEGAPPLTEAGAAMAGDLPGLTALGPPERFNAETLSDKIDGKAELYLSSGFKAMTCRSFSIAEGEAAGARLEVFLYEMESPMGAFAVFSGQRRSGAATSTVTRDAYMTENALFFASGAHYMEIVADRASPAITATLSGAASAMLAGLPGGAPEATADPAALFPRTGLNAETVRLTASDAFGLEGFNNVYSGEYATEAGEATAFLSLAETRDAALAMAENYLKFLKQNGFKEESAEGLPDGATLLSLEGYFEVVFTRGRFLAGVHEATTAAAAAAVAREIGTALEAHAR